jgi:hypothetical protein
MHNKPYKFCGIFLSLGLCIPTAHALDCSVVAQIHLADNIEAVGILRANQPDEHQWASRKNKELCAGDLVIVPKSIPRLIIRYYTDDSRKETLTMGQQYRVKALDKPCAAACKFKEWFAGFIKKLTSKDANKPTIKSGWKGKSGKLRPINTPLAAGEGASESFSLFAREGAIPLFWYGGKSPYRVVVQNAMGKIVVKHETTAHNSSLRLTDIEPNTEYRLTVQSVGTQSCQKENSKICQKRLVFSVPPFPLVRDADPYEMLATLLADCDKNWRLEVWRQLSTMPDSEKKRRFIKLLKADADYIDPYQQGLCQ